MVRPRRRISRTPPIAALLAAILAIAVGLASPPSPAAGTTRATSGGSTTSGKGAPRKADSRQKEPAPAPSGPLAGLPTRGAGTEELGASGQVDPISGLGIRNPVCDHLAQIEAERTRLSCQLNGTPESNYPASNYGFDVFIDTGIDAPTGTFAKGLVMILNGVWLGLLFVLKLVFALLGLAFALNPFGEGETMARIAGAIGRVYARIVDPWLSALIVCAGIGFAHKGLIRREVAAGVAGTLAAIALLILGLWIVHAPRESVGRAAKLSDQLALGVIAAPQEGSFERPSGSYAEAMSRAWAQLVEVPFAGLNFSDVEWALGPPPPEAVERADRKLCADVGALALLAVLSRLGEERASQACAAFARRRYGAPRRVIDLYLRSSPGSPARRELWEYFDKDEGDAYKAKVAAQGGDGVLTRLSMLALFAIGLLGALLLLAWLAIRLFTQASIGFVLLLAAPFALFFPLLGDSGRRAFKTWGLTLLGAIAAKVIYAAFLAVALMGMRILGGVGGAMGFLLTCAFAWSVFLRRADLIGWLSIGEIDRAASRGILGEVAAFALARRMGRAVGGVVRSAARAVPARAGVHAADRAEATRLVARDSLGDSARSLAEQRHREARRAVTEFEVRHGRPRPTGKAEPARGRDSDLGSKSPPVAQRIPALPAPSAAERQRYEQARELLARADRNQRSFGERWSEHDLERFAEEDRALLRDSRDPAEHAHRAGLARSEFEALRGPDRERVEEAIERARRRDRQRLEAAAEAPGRVVGRARQGAEALRQRAEGTAPERREHLRRLRRERGIERLASRRNLSRGA
jgi:hypothetical protein